MRNRTALNSFISIALVPCICIAAGCSSTTEAQDRVRKMKKTVSAYKREMANLKGDSEESLKLKKIKLSVRMAKNIKEWLEHHPEAKEMEIIDPCITLLKMAIELNPNDSKKQFIYAWCLKERGHYHYNNANRFSYQSDGLVFYKPTKQWREAENPPSPERVAELRELEKQERNKARPFLEQALQKTRIAMQIARAADPNMLKMQAETYLLLAKPLEAYEIYIRLSRNQGIAPSEQLKCKQWAERVKKDPGYKKALQERRRRRSTP